MSVTRLDVLNRIAECEKNGEFDKHVDPINYDIMLPVDKSFPYVDKPFWLRVRYFFEKIFIIKPFCLYQNAFKLKTKFYGRENLKGIKTAVVTCNHVNMWDCLVMKQGLKGHRLYITAAYFNNQKGFLGEMMRAADMMPLGKSHGVMKKFCEAVEKVLSGKNYLLIYPEQAMWWNYEKPRPFKDGAFHFAAKAQVPVIPCFITFTETGEKDEQGIPKKTFNLNIMPPIYPKKELSVKENTDYMRDKNYELCKAKYEEFYGKKLVYTCDEKTAD